jgi:hypothetical protein
VGNAIAFSIYNKPFKPLDFPSGRVKSREGLAEMIPTNILFFIFLKCNIHVISKNEASLQ